MLQDQKPLIERVRQDTRSIRKSYSLQLDLTADADRQASSEKYSIFNSSIGDEDFSFDDEIINSFAYRKAIKRLASKAKATQHNAKPDERHILDEPLIDFEELSQTHNGPRTKSTAISNHHSLTPTKTSTHTALLSDTIMEDLKSLMPTSIGSPGQQINEGHAEFASPSYVSESPNNGLANQRDKDRDVEKVTGQYARDDVSQETLNFRMLPRKPVRASAEPFQRSSQSPSIAADAVEDFDKLEKGREGAFAHASHHSEISLLNEYFEGGKGPNVHSRPGVRVKVTPLAARKIKDTNKHVQVTASRCSRKTSFTRRISLGPPSSGERQPTEIADDKSISSYTSAPEESSLAHRYPPVEVKNLNRDHVEVKILNRDQESNLSGRNIAREERYTHVNSSDISSMPPDSILKGKTGSIKPRRGSRSASRDTNIATNISQTLSSRRSPSLSKEVPTYKVMKRLAEESRDVSGGKHKRSSETRSRSASNEQLAEDVKSRPRRSSKGHKEGEKKSSLLTSQLSPRRESSDLHPRLRRETVGTAICRLIAPELETLKQEHKIQQVRQRRESRGSIDSGDLPRNRDEHNTGRLLSGDSSKGRKEHRRDRTSYSPSERISERNRVFLRKLSSGMGRNSPKKEARGIN